MWTWLISGVLVHGPEGDDRVEPAGSWIRVAGVESTVPSVDPRMPLPDR